MLESGKVTKPVDAHWPVGLRFHGEDLEGLLITDVTVTVLPATGLTIGTGHVNADADGVWVMAEGGVAGTDYFILFVWTRSDGMITPDILRVCVR